jgi:hypothetical protein
MLWGSVDNIHGSSAVFQQRKSCKKVIEELNMEKGDNKEWEKYRRG